MQTSINHNIIIQKQQLQFQKHQETITKCLRDKEIRMKILSQLCKKTSNKLQFSLKQFIQVLNIMNFIYLKYINNQSLLQKQLYLKIINCYYLLKNQNKDKLTLLNLAIFILIFLNINYQQSQILKQLSEIIKKQYVQENIKHYSQQQQIKIKTLCNSLQNTKIMHNPQLSQFTQIKAFSNQKTRTIKKKQAQQIQKDLNLKKQFEKNQQVFLDKKKQTTLSNNLKKGYMYPLLRNKKQQNIQNIEILSYKAKNQRTQIFYQKIKNKKKAQVNGQQKVLTRYNTAHLNKQKHKKILNCGWPYSDYLQKKINQDFQIKTNKKILKQQKSLKNILLYLDINFNQNQLQRIIVYEGDKPEQLAQNFSKKFSNFEFIRFKQEQGNKPYQSIEKNYLKYSNINQLGRRILKLILLQLLSKFFI